MESRKKRSKKRDTEKEKICLWHVSEKRVEKELFARRFSVKFRLCMDFFNG